MSRENAEEVWAYCERTGYDSAVNGANETNCHFTLFSTPERMQAWEKGRRRGDKGYQARGIDMTNELHYFDRDEAPTSDILLAMAKGQGYVPKGCLLGGAVVMSEVNAGRDPCAGCAGPRLKCGGRPPKPEGSK